MTAIGRGLDRWSCASQRFTRHEGEKVDVLGVPSIRWSRRSLVPRWPEVGVSPTEGQVSVECPEGLRLGCPQRLESPAERTSVRWASQIGGSPLLMLGFERPFLSFKPRDKLGAEWCKLRRDHVVASGCGASGQRCALGEAAW